MRCHPGMWWRGWLAVWALAGCHVGPEDGVSMVFRTGFDRAELSDWVVETRGGSVTVRGGVLDIDVPGGCTVWFRRRLVAPVRISAAVTVVDRGGPNDRVSDLNCFWMATDPQHPEDLFARSEERGGVFANYHGLRLYYLGMGGNSNTTTRFRRYPGTGERPLLPEHDWRDPSVLLQANRPVILTIEVTERGTRYWRDGRLLLDFEDPDPLTEGWFGFRTVHNHMQVDWFKVETLDNEN